MKAVILAGGLGTRLAEETHLKPKPMVEIGGKPIIWHIMKIYSAHNIKNFIICCGYKGYMIKEFFANYAMHSSDITIELRNNEIKFHRKNVEDWQITLVDTGEKTMTGGRLKRISAYLDHQEPFCLTYGDGVANVDITQSIIFHKGHGKLATVTAVQPPGRFGALSISNNAVKEFQEKPIDASNNINGGFFVLSPKVIELIAGDQTTWEEEPLRELALKNELMAFDHSGFWQPMDTLRDKNNLESLWNSGNAPWKVW